MNGDPPVPIDAGLRVVARGPRRSAGLMLMRQGRDAGLDHSTIVVGRAVQQVGSQHRFGALVVSRLDDPADAASLGPRATLAADGLVRVGGHSTVSGLGSATFSPLDGSIGTARGLAGYVQVTHATRTLNAAWTEE